MRFFSRLFHRQRQPQAETALSFTSEQPLKEAFIIDDFQLDLTKVSQVLPPDPLAVERATHRHFSMHATQDDIIQLFWNLIGTPNEGFDASSLENAYSNVAALQHQAQIPDADASLRARHVYADLTMLNQIIVPEMAALSRLLPPDPNAINRIDPPRLDVDDPQAFSLHNRYNLLGLLLAALPSSPTTNDLTKIHQAVSDLLETDSWDKTRAILEERSALLFTPQAREWLAQAIQQSYQQGGEQGGREYLQMHQRLLDRASQDGIPRAWEQFEQEISAIEEREGIDTASETTVEESTDSLLTTLLIWLNTPTFRQERHYLETHSLLLDAPSQVMQLMKDLLQGVTDADERETITTALTLMQDIHHRIEQGYEQTIAIRDAYINLNSIFPLALPHWLDKALVQDERIHHLDNQSKHTRITLWRRTLARSLRDRLPAEIVTAVQLKIAEALHDDPLPNPAHAKEEELQILQAALTIYTFDRYPIRWAEIQYNMGNAYHARVEGKVAENLESAFRAYQSALQVFTKEHFPDFWAESLGHLGDIYHTQTHGNHAENLEAALEAYISILKVFTHSHYPQEWARTLRNIGIIFSERVYGSRTQNSEAALLAYQQSLSVYTRERFPREWAKTQISLGGILPKRLRGSHADNLEAALVVELAALEIVTIDQYPVEWGEAQTNLGTVYIERIRGERADNVEAALIIFLGLIPHYPRDRSQEDWAVVQSNLSQIFVKRTFGNRATNIEVGLATLYAVQEVMPTHQDPHEMAFTQINLGSLYYNRVRGTFADNIEASLAAYQAALVNLPVLDYPFEWAGIQASLGAVYGQRMYGDQADNRDASIASLLLSLRVYTRDRYPREWAGALLNLGSAYSSRTHGSRSHNLEAAMAAELAATQVFTREEFPEEWAQTQGNLGGIFQQNEQADHVDTEEAAIAACQAALDVFTREGFPIEWATVQNLLGIAYLSRQIGTKTSNGEAAIAAFLNALQIYTPERFPLDHRNVCLNLATFAATELTVQKDTRALDLAHAAFSAARKVQQELSWIAATPLGKAIARGDTLAVRQMYANDAWVLTVLGNERQAIEVLDEGRAHALAESLALGDVDLLNVPTSLAVAFAQSRLLLSEVIREGRTEQIVPARAQLTQIIDAIRQHQPDFLRIQSYDDIVHSAVDRTLLYLAVTEQGCLVLCIPQGGGNPYHLQLSTITKDVVEQWLTQRSSDGWVTGGYRFFSQRQAGGNLLRSWIQYLRRDIKTDMEVPHLATLPLQRLADAIDPLFVSLKVGLLELLSAWNRTVVQLEEGTNTQQQQAQMLYEQLTLPLEAVLENPAFGPLLLNDLTRLVHQVELKILCKSMGNTLMQPIYTWLSDLGLLGDEAAIGLLPTGTLSQLPLNIATVHTRTGEEIPFQDAATLTYQANARSLAAARTRGLTLAGKGNFLIIASPQPSHLRKLVWAEREGQILENMIRQSGRLASRPGIDELGNKTLVDRALIGEEARLTEVLEALTSVGRTQSGAWLTIAAHGYADPADPKNTFLLLANDRRLSLDLLQRQQLFGGFREVNAEGCVTGVSENDFAPDEVISFAGGVLQAGAAAVLATQWSVSDYATALLMVRRTQLVLEDPTLSPAQALQRAAYWLHTAPRDEIDALRSLAMQGNDGILPDELRGVSALGEPDNTIPLQNDLQYGFTKMFSALTPDPSVNPFDHPFFWGAFVLWGW